MDYLTGAAKAGVSIQSFKVTQSGAAPLVVNFEALGLPNMANADYVVITGGETASRTTVDESAITAAGFEVLAGADTEVHHLLVVGTLKRQAVAE